MNASTRPPATCVIATRESRLALWQAQHIQQRLQAQGLQATLLGMTTRGDQILDRSLSKVGGKGLFVKELEAALADGRAHLAVHSLKDVPMELPAGFALACVPERGNPHDAFVSNHYARLEDLPEGAVVGTSSLRRQVLLQHLRPDLRIEPLRGNLDTRLRKLDEGQFSAIVLAAAGLERLQLAGRIRMQFTPEQMLPAAGQGALGIEVLAAQPHTPQAQQLQTALQALSHLPTWLATAAERAVSRALGGSCSVPLAAHAVWAEAPDTLWLRAAWGDPQGQRPLVQVQASAAIATLAQAQALGEQVAQLLRQAGAQV
ncbi:hydroxymethylbilane synthase [Vandammella animalimorsus]|uniref:Porphobilinogen deaminase n=1 Tax=Vandammella animalimorsus TaxID=2029117 RepID=A0A2A2AXQ0_9BURK|nr:hydroxymethylbilane synthase [Vandammella animalimorsus]PAT42508.1 hydroxymethylbilane synthase [Vandammella animalimorsus]